MEPLSFKKEFTTYLSIDKSLSENTISTYLRYIKNLPKKDVKLITYKDIVEVINNINLLEISTSTQSLIILSFKNFFEFLISYDIIQLNPCSNIENPKVSHKLPEILSIEEISMVIESFSGDSLSEKRNRSILETLYSCGIRVTELTTLKISNLFLDSGYIKVTGKGDKERLIPIGKVAIDSIKDYLMIRNKPKEKYEDTLYINDKGDELHSSNILLIVKEAMNISGIKKNVYPHIFRHSFATHLIENGTDIRMVQEMLGHKQITSTEIYTHLSLKFLETTMAKSHPMFKKKTKMLIEAERKGLIKKDPNPQTKMLKEAEKVNPQPIMTLDNNPKPMTLDIVGKFLQIVDDWNKLDFSDFTQEKNNIAIANNLIDEAMYLISKNWDCLKDIEYETKKYSLKGKFLRFNP